MVLTMEFCEGGQIDNLAYIQANKLDRHQVRLSISLLNCNLFVTDFLFYLIFKMAFNI